MVGVDRMDVRLHYFTHLGVHYAELAANFV